MDKLQEMFKKWNDNIAVAPATEFQAFQGGVTAGAVSMRDRAVEAVRSNSAGDVNAIINAIGALSDIPS